MASDGVPTFDAMDVVKSVQGYKARESALMTQLQAQLLAVQQSSLPDVEKAGKLKELLESCVAQLKKDDPMADACRQYGIPLEKLYQ